MKTETKTYPRIAGCRRTIPALVAAVLAVGGCAATYVDDAWQCPLAQGTACTSVAEADPAVTPAAKPQPAKRDLSRGAEAVDPGEFAPGCVRSCDPLGWLVQWLGSAEERDEIAAAAGPEPVSPAERSPGAASEGLRTKERIGRIWIAPFVDAEGVYREGHWVRAVIEPARWRLR